MRVAVIGLGDIAQKAYLPVLTQLSNGTDGKKNLELIFCSRNANTLQHLSQQYRVKTCFQDYRQLNKSNVDAVMIHSSTHSHPEITRYFLQQRIATFVDKPLADNAADCEKLYELAAQNHTPLYLGFNRRFIPLYNQHLVGVQQNKPLKTLQSLRWEKNRHNLPADIRRFIFDDFIHCIDSVNIYGKSNLNAVNVTTQFSTNNDHLTRIDVKWQQNSTILEASMNRNFGITQEIISANYENESYQFNSFVSGTHWQNNKTLTLSLADWTPMLASKGFVDMINDWLLVAESGVMASEVINRNLSSHLLAEALCQKLTT
jgi:virulence factor